MICMEFEIKKQQYTNKTFRLPVELTEQLAITASENDIFMNELVVQSCEFALKHLKPLSNEPTE